MASPTEAGPSSEFGPLNIRVANTFLSRLRGLLFRRPMSISEGLLIVPCSSIHTFFMRYDVDVVFLDRSCRIRKIIPRLKPWRAAFSRRSHQVLELAAGGAEARGLVVGSLYKFNLTDGNC